MKFAVGQRVWFFDENRRVYNVKSSWGPIYDHHYIECTVVGVEKRSYLIVREHGDPGKFSFDKAERLFKTDCEKEDDVYLKTNRIRLSDLVRGADVEVLRRVAAIFE